jgi:hypothetical protein
MVKRDMQAESCVFVEGIQRMASSRGCLYSSGMYTQVAYVLSLTKSF